MFTVGYFYVPGSSGAGASGVTTEEQALLNDLKSFRDAHPLADASLLEALTAVKSNANLGYSAYSALLNWAQGRGSATIGPALEGVPTRTETEKRVFYEIQSLRFDAPSIVPPLPVKAWVPNHLTKVTWSTTGSATDVAAWIEWFEALPVWNLWNSTNSTVQCSFFFSEGTSLPRGIRSPVNNGITNQVAWNLPSAFTVVCAFTVLSLGTGNDVFVLKMNQLRFVILRTGVIALRYDTNTTNLRAWATVQKLFTPNTTLNVNETYVFGISINVSGNNLRIAGNIGAVDAGLAPNQVSYTVERSPSVVVPPVMSSPTYGTTLSSVDYAQWGNGSFFNPANGTTVTTAPVTGFTTSPTATMPWNVFWGQTDLATVGNHTHDLILHDVRLYDSDLQDIQSLVEVTHECWNDTERRADNYIQR